MAIAVMYRPPALTAAQYEESWADGSPVAPPPGLIFHAGMGDGADFVTLTVWQLREAYDAFAPTFTRAMEAKGLQIETPQTSTRVRSA